MAEKPYITNTSNTGTQEIKAPSGGKKKAKPTVTRGKDLRNGK